MQRNIWRRGMQAERIQHILPRRASAPRKECSQAAATKKAKREAVLPRHAKAERSRQGTSERCASAEDVPREANMRMNQRARQ